MYIEYKHIYQLAALQVVSPKHIKNFLNKDMWSPTPQTVSLTIVRICEVSKPSCEAEE